MSFCVFFWYQHFFLVKVRFSIPIVKYNDEENKMRVMVLAGSRDSKNLRSSLGFFIKFQAVGYGRSDRRSPLGHLQSQG